MKYLTGILALVVLVACDNKPPQQTVFDSQIKLKEKARAVEGQLKEAAERRDEEVRNIDKVDTD